MLKCRHLAGDIAGRKYGFQGILPVWFQQRRLRRVRFSVWSGRFKSTSAVKLVTSVVWSFRVSRFSQRAVRLYAEVTARLRV
jgi:hypothetical protein